MPLEPGARLDSLRILRQIGQGGMGAVYLAHDERLNRDVAVKVLPDGVAQDPDRLARFRREAQALASLSHAHIAQVYGLIEFDGTLALAMEFVEGQTLESMLAGGPIPLDESLALAGQIAAGLEAAHERGIVHRDLKPANIMVSPRGEVKILDFGLAKATEPQPVALMDSPTMLAPTATVRGVILGTAAYMSPEQARGRPVDKRTDIWAFGAVLWEMLTGRRLFAGETVTDVLAAIVSSAPAWTELPAATPARVRTLLERCLARDPQQRLRDIGEARIALQQVEAGATAPPVVSGGAGSAMVSRRWFVAASGIAAAAVLGMAALWFLGDRGRPGAAPAMTFDIRTPPGTELRLLERPAIAISPDGSTMAFAAGRGDALEIYVRRRNEATSRALPVRTISVRQGGEMAFSPDGRYLAVTDGVAVTKVPLDGGPPVRLAPILSGTRGLAWVDDRHIVYSPAPRTGLWIVDTDGGEPRELTKVSVDQNERSHRWPAALPGGKAILFTVGALGSPDSYDDASIDALVLATGERRRIFSGAAFARYAPDGRLILARGGSLYAVQFDPERLVVSGEPKLVLPNVGFDPNTGATHFAVAADGTLIYAPGSAVSGLRSLAWVDKSGNAQPLDLAPDVFNDPSISPDGSRAAVLVGPIGHGDVWVYDFRQTTFTRVTSDGRSATPVWSGDGRWLYYVSIDTPQRRTLIMRRAADGSGAPEPVTSTDLRAYLGSILPDGVTAIGAANRWAGSFEVVRTPLRQGAPLTPLTRSNTQAYCADVSPDGRWFAYSSEESGRREVYVQGVSGSDARWMVSTEGGEEPHWAPDGRTLYYRVDDRLMAVPIQSGVAFTAGKPTLALRGMYDLQSETGLSYAVDPRTGRFLMIRLASDRGGPPADTFRVVLNWAR